MSLFKTYSTNHFIEGGGTESLRGIKIAGAQQEGLVLYSKIYLGTT
jgi:hypothetical protein